MTKSTPITFGAGDTYARRFLFLATTMLVGMALLAGCNADRDEPKQDTEKLPEITYLDQGWSSDLRTRYYFDPQGSRLIPYDWFVALEQRDSDRPFIDHAHVEALGYLAAAPGPMNPDGLPIGFVKDPADNPETGHWMGFTCAACHTNDMVLAGRRVRVDGGPPLADFETFMTRLNDAVVATLGNDAKFERFADRVAPKDGAKALRGRLLDYQSSLTALVERNRTPHPYGAGRLDAFGHILNAVSGHALDEPRNIRPPDAPVSYPFLWLTPKLEWVQWNGSAANPMGRNVGEVLGTFGTLELVTTPDKMFTSSVIVDDLAEMEAWLHQLKPPAWPETILGPLDPAKVEAGRVLYERDCKGCHNLPPYRMTAAKDNIAGLQFIKVTMIPYKKVGTDPRMIENFGPRTAFTGALANVLFDRREQVSAGEYLSKVVGATVSKDFTVRRIPKKKQLAYSGFRYAPDGTPDTPKNILAYKAGPLAGVWATAPYLHNGSVPTLDDLLRPPAERPDAFYVGSRAFDPVRVGYKNRAADLTEADRARSFRYDTSIPGNSNAGHTYANPARVVYTDDDRLALIEFLKSL